MSLNKSTVGLRVLRHVLGLPLKEAGDVLGRVKPYLTYAEDETALAFIQAHLAKHGKLPHPETIMDQVHVFLPETTETLSFDMDRLRGRFLEDGLRTAVEDASALLEKNQEADALSAMLSVLMPLTKSHGGQNIFDLRETGELAVDLYKKQLAGLTKPVQTLGLPTIDKQGGIEDGDMIGLVGRPGSGKTWLMLATAIERWNAWSEPVMFVTQEMSAPQIEKRLLPIIAGVPATPLYKGVPHQYELNGLTHEQYMDKLSDAAEALKYATNPFLIYDSKMAGTVADIEAIAAVHGVRKVWIDGAYMLAHPDTRLNRYGRVPENLDLLKRFGQRTGTMTVSSWQFKRGGGKADALGEAPDLDDIGYSHAIGEYMGVVMGLLENPKSLTQMNTKTVTIMKGRNGEVGSFKIKWDFETMEFFEVSAEETTADLTYL